MYMHSCTEQTHIKLRPLIMIVDDYTVDDAYRSRNPVHAHTRAHSNTPERDAHQNQQSRYINKQYMNKTRSAAIHENKMKRNETKQKQNKR